MIDLHCHTKFSFDSKEKIDNYLEKTDIFIQTDHHDPIENHLFDVNAYRKEIKKYDDKIVLTGAEVGYDPDCKEEVKKYISKNNFDVVLLSHHHSIKSDSFEDIENYLKLYNEMIEEIEDFDVLTHFDFPFRYRKITLEQLIEHEETIKSFLKALISKGKYLELNAMSIYHHQNKEFYDYIIKLYDSIGGKKYSIGSDGHRISEYKFQFDKILTLLDDIEDYELLNTVIENKYRR